MSSHEKASAPAANGRDAPRDDLSIYEILNVPARHWRALLILPLLLAAALVAVALARHRTYTADASFTPQNSPTPNSRLLGMAAQFGLDVGARGGQSGEFYADLLRTRQLLEAAAMTEYTFSGDGGTLRGDVAQLYRVQGATPALRRDAAVRRLSEAVSVSVNPKTDVVAVSVTTRWAPLSMLVAQRLIALVNEFNLTMRHSQAMAEREFVQARLAQAKLELRQAEDRLEAFQVSNRQFQDSPELLFQRERLQRNVSLAQTTYTNLAQAFEQARIEEVRNTPQITVVQRPEQPALPNSRRVPVQLLLGLMLGLALAVVYAFLAEVSRTLPQTEREDVAEFRRLLSGMRSDVRRMVFPFRRQRDAMAVLAGVPATDNGSSAETRRQRES